LGEPAKGLGERGIVRGQDSLPSLQSAIVRRFGETVKLLVVVHPGHVVEDLGEGRMLGPEGRTPDARCTLVQGLGAFVLTLSIIQRDEVVQRLGDRRVIDAAGPLSNDEENGVVLLSLSLLALGLVE
jgi:hypothetical protein